MSDLPPEDPATFWNDRYAGDAKVWSGEPNRALVQAASDLRPGRALDLGCGEGGDSVWLAERGWDVTAVDVSILAIQRARAHGVAAEIDSQKITWVVADLTAWEPDGCFDLVSACFLQSPIDFPRHDVLRRAAGAVAPGGRLLVVAHAEPPPWDADHEQEQEQEQEQGRGHEHGPRHAEHCDGRRHRHDPVDPAQEIADLGLDAEAWETGTSNVIPRPATGTAGERGTLLDSVVLLRRRSTAP